jgi:polyisoprenoid-binding protein YceI
MNVRILFPLLFALVLPACSGGDKPPPAQGESEIRFAVKQMGVTLTGKFTRFSAQVQLDPEKPEAAHARIEVDVASLDMGDDEADETARSRPWLDAAGFPKAAFEARGARALGGDRYEATGTLSLRGQSREITVPFTLGNLEGGGRVASGEFPIRRTDFGVGGGEWDQSDLVANEVVISFRVTLGAPH